MARRNSIYSPPMPEQVPNNPKLGIEIPLGFPEPSPEQDMTPSPVAPNENVKNFLGIFYRVCVESLNDWATDTQFMRGIHSI